MKNQVATRRQRKGFLSLRSGKKKIQRFSLRYRSAILFNKLKELEIITPFEENGSTKIISDFCHKLKGSYLVSNNELEKFVFAF